MPSLQAAREFCAPPIAAVRRLLADGTVASFEYGAGFNRIRGLSERKRANAGKINPKSCY